MEDDWQEKLGFWMMWTGVAMFFLWLVAKMTGLINTPLWLQYIPQASSLVAVIGFLVWVGQKLGQPGFFEKRFEMIDRRFDGVDRIFDRMEEDIKDIRVAVNSNTGRIIRIEAKLS